MCPEFHHFPDPHKMDYREDVAFDVTLLTTSAAVLCASVCKPGRPHDRL